MMGLFNKKAQEQEPQPEVAPIRKWKWAVDTEHGNQTVIAHGFLIMHGGVLAFYNLPEVERPKTPIYVMHGDFIRAFGSGEWSQLVPMGFAEDSDEYIYKARSN